MVANLYPFDINLDEIKTNPIRLVESVWALASIRIRSEIQPFRIALDVAVHIGIPWAEAQKWAKVHGLDPREVDMAYASEVESR
jgi:hypothetical protein